MQYFRTTAETSYQFLAKNFDFVENHTALDDACIESELLVKMLNQHRKKVEPKIEPFPFRTLGTIFQFVTTNPRGKKYIPMCTELLREYINENCGYSKENSVYWRTIIKQFETLLEMCEF